MEVTRISPLTGKPNTINIPITEDEYKAALAKYRRGGLIQDVFPTLTKDQREFVKTGLTAEDWKVLYPPET